MQLKNVLFIVMVMIFALFATAFMFQDTSQLSVRWAKEMKIDTIGGPTSYVWLKETAGPTLFVTGPGDEMDLLVNGHGSFNGTISSYVHTVDGQFQKLFLLRLQNPAPGGFKCIDFGAGISSDAGAYLIHWDDYNNWETTGEFLTSGPLGILTDDPIGNFQIEVADGSIAAAWLGSLSDGDGEVLAALHFGGEDDLPGETESYASVWGAIVDGSEGTQDGKLSLAVLINGLSTNVVNILGSAMGVGTELPSEELEVHVGDAFVEVMASSERDGDGEGLGRLSFEGRDDGANETKYAGVRGAILDNADGSEDGEISLETIVDGLFTKMLTIQKAFVGVGEAITPAYLFDVIGNKGANGDNFVARIFNDGNNADRQVLILQGGADDGSDATTYISMRDGDGNEVGGLEHDTGTVQLFQASGTERTTQQGGRITTSTIKENITTTTLDTTNIARRLRVCDYDLVESGERVLGQFTADQIETVFPEMVSESAYTKQLDTGTTVTTWTDSLTTPGLKIRHDEWVWDYEKITQKVIQPLRLIPVLIKAFQELDAQSIGQGVVIGEMVETIGVMVEEILGQQNALTVAHQRIDALEQRQVNLEALVLELLERDK